MRIILFIQIILNIKHYMFIINKHNLLHFFFIFIYTGFSGGNFRSQNGGMGGRSNFMDQPGAGGNRGGIGRYPDSGSRDFSRPNVSQFPGGSRGDRRPDFESLPPPPS